MYACMCLWLLECTAAAVYDVVLLYCSYYCVIHTCIIAARRIQRPPSLMDREGEVRRTNTRQTMHGIDRSSRHVIMCIV